MSRICYLLPPYIGHLNPALALAEVLRARGYELTFISAPDGAAKVQQAGFPFLPIGEAEFPPGKWIELSRELGRLKGLSAGDFTVRWAGRFTRVILAEFPGLLARERFDGCVVDQVAFGGSSACSSRGVKSVTVCHTLPLHFEPAVPVYFSNRGFSESWWARFLNRFAQRMVLLSGHRVFGPIAAFRHVNGLPRLSYDALYHGEDTSAQVCQLPAFLDFPRRHCPNLVYTGPWISRQRTTSGPNFPWDRLNGAPLVYASMGTLQNGVAQVFFQIAEACVGLDVRLVIALGGNNRLAEVDGLPGKPIVVAYAPQQQLLERASATITHAGMNTALESAAAGVPIVAVPVTNDQPGVAARLAYHGLAQVIPVQKLRAENLRSAVRRALTDSNLRERAKWCAKELSRIDGPRLAAEACVTALGLPQARHKMGTRQVQAAGKA